MRYEAAGKYPLELKNNNIYVYVYIPKALLYPVRLHSRVRTTNFVSGLGTLDGQHVFLPLNVTLAIRSHLPRRWETVFRWTMKAIAGSTPVGRAALLQTGANLMESACSSDPYVSLPRKATNILFPHLKICFRSQISELEWSRGLRSSSVRAAPARLVWSARRPTRAGGGWVCGWVGSATSERMLQAPRSRVSFSLRKKKKKELLLQISKRADVEPRSEYFTPK